MKLSKISLLSILISFLIILSPVSAYLPNMTFNNSGYIGYQYTGAGIDNWTAPANCSVVEYILVAAGGGGGASRAGGGGGGGILNGSINVIANSTIITISLGTGGLGGAVSVPNYYNGTDGGNSSIIWTITGITQNITVNGGGGGGGGSGTRHGRNGGSGGGGSGNGDIGGNGGLGTLSQGNNGGKGSTMAAEYGGGGGGGWGGPGTDGTSTSGGAAGTGYTTSWNGTSVTYSTGGAGTGTTIGGGGSNTNPGSGGNGGAVSGGGSPGRNGTVILRYNPGAIPALTEVIPKPNFPAERKIGWYTNNAPLAGWIALLLVICVIVFRRK